MFNVKRAIVSISVVILFAVLLSQILQSSPTSSSHEISDRVQWKEVENDDSYTISWIETEDSFKQCFRWNQNISGCLPNFIFLTPGSIYDEKLDDYLQSSEQLKNSSMKLDYYSSIDTVDFSAYLASFHGFSQRYYDSSPTYLYYNTVPLTIRKASPTSRFVALLIAPEQRFLLTFTNFIKHHVPKICQEIPIEDYIQEELNVYEKCNVNLNIPKVWWKVEDRNPIPEICEPLYWPQESCRYLLSWEEKENVMTVFSKRLFLSQNLYIYHLHRWFRYFDKNQIHVLEYDHLWDQPNLLWDFMDLQQPSTLPNRQLRNLDLVEIAPETMDWVKTFYSSSTHLLQNEYNYLFLK